MAKIMVPQELQNQIIDLYVNKNYTRVQIKRELNLTFGDSVIKRILEENNIPIKTNPGAQKGGRKKQEVDIELQKQIIEAYNKGWSQEKIVRELSLPFTFDKVRSILIDNGIHIRNNKEAYVTSDKPELRKYPVNDDYCLESHNGAWFLGMIASDGYLPITKGARNRITLTLSEIDEEILHRIADELNYKGPIYHFDSHGYPSVSLSFASRKIREQMEAYGVVNNKTFKLQHLPNLPEEYIIDFIRGYFDGDGSIFDSLQKKVPGMSITCACKDFLQEISNFLHIKYNVSNVNVREFERVHTIYDIRYGKKDTLILGEIFYNNNYLSLQRKKDKYFFIKDKYAN